MSNLQTNYHFKQDFQGFREYKHDIKDSEGNKFNPIFKKNAQRWKHLESWAFAEPELLRYIKPKRVVQNEKNGYKMPIRVTIIMMKIMMKYNYQGNSKRST